MSSWFTFGSQMCEQASQNANLSPTSRYSVPIWAAAVASLKMAAERPFRNNIRAVEMLKERKY